MHPSQNISRTDILELKALIFQKIGHQRGQKYFDLLSRFLSFKISKAEFDKFCIRIIGRENIPLHTRLIRALLKNACLAKVPPPFRSERKMGGSLSVKVTNGYQSNSLQSIYGDASPSPQEGRSPISRDRKFQDRPSPLGPYRKAQNVSFEKLNPKAQERQSATELHSLGSRPIEVISVEEGEEVEQAAGSPGVQSRSPVTAPLGISMNFGGARKFHNISSCHGYNLKTCQNGSELPDTRSLRSQLERKLDTEGMSISVDCANLLNNALDAYLKRLIEPCMSLAGSRNGNKQLRKLKGKPVLGLRGFYHETHMQREDQTTSASLLDFQVAMELTPQILGKDWTLQLEKIGLRASEE